MDALVTTAGRRSYRRRCTREIWLEVSVDLGRAQPVFVATDIGFLNQLVEQMARSGEFALRLFCEGGPRADARLIVEDCAIELGAALAQAAGRGFVGRRLELAVAVERAQATVVLDLSGRPGAAVAGEFGCRWIGGLPTDLVPAFFERLGQALGARIHVDAGGEITPHVITACFKGVGLALRGAIRA